MMNLALKSLTIFLLSGQIVLSQEYSSSETIDYINNLVDDPKFELFIKNGKLEQMETQKGESSLQQRVHISDISKTRVSTDRTIGVYLDCVKKSNCSLYYMPDGEGVPMPYFVITTKSNQTAEKISNAVRHLIENEKNYNDDSDPFAAYGTDNEVKDKLNISDLEIGMEKKTVFQILNTKPLLESRENEYEVYRVIRNDQYFIYFSNNTLTRIDKGESIGDTIIIID